jgi:hypothetical protein
MLMRHVIRLLKKHLRQTKTVAFMLIVITAMALISPPANSGEKAKLFYVNSYHRGYEWSDSIEKGLLKALNIQALAGGGFDTTHSPVEFQLFRMDTKLNQSEAFKQEAALAARSLIDRWQPDIVVASDDNAAKYLIAPYLKNTAMPVVFCGLDGDAAVYGFPAANVTGMIEVDPLLETIQILTPYARGRRIGYIGTRNIGNSKKVPHHRDLLGVHYTDGQLVSNVAEWEQAFMRLQETVDILIVFSLIGMEGWDRAQAEKFIHAHTTIPTGSLANNTIRLTLVGKVKIGEEQGNWAGHTALRILSGTSPTDIPVAMNQYSRIYLNMKLAQRLGIRFPMELIEKATLIEELPESE